MVGSIAIGLVLARFVFVSALIAGWWEGDISLRSLGIAAALGVWAWAGLPGTPLGPGLALAMLAAIDIVLVLRVWGDVRLT